MTQLTDLATDASVVALVERGVLADMALALSGTWQPADEPDLERRRAIVAAARLRLYADHERGWVLLTSQDSRDAISSDGSTEWSIGFVPALESFDDAPLEDDIDGMARVIADGDELSPWAARTLALAILTDRVTMVVAHDPPAFHHQRTHDLPERLHIIDPVEACDRLDLRAGETPLVAPPKGSELAQSVPWWIP